MRILLLSTWLPYPLTQGSKIRAYHLLCGLAAQHELALVSFAETRYEPVWVDHLRQFCQRVDLVERDPFVSNGQHKLQGWLSRQPSAVLNSYEPQMARQVQETAAHWQPDLVLALTFVTAPYALQLGGIRKVFDIDNVMTQMLYEEYCTSNTQTSRLRKWLAWQKFYHYERMLLHRFDLTLAVSTRDLQLLQGMVHKQSKRVTLIPNGVDLAASPVSAQTPEPDHLIFNGALTYPPNHDAMDYFLGEVWPLIRTQAPAVQLTITGQSEPLAQEKFAAVPGVRFTGHLPDVRPTVRRAWASIAPLRIGGGTRLKILEAMALGTPVVTTRKGIEGIEAIDGEHLLIGRTPQEFAEKVVQLLRKPALRQYLAQNARCLVEQKYDWRAIGTRLCHAVEQLATVKRPV